MIKKLYYLVNVCSQVSNVLPYTGE